MSKNNVIDVIMGLLGPHATNYNILEEQIDIGLQMEYFELSAKLSTQDPPPLRDIEANTATLHKPDTGIEAKRKALTLLATTKDTAAYRVIEKYAQDPLDELKDWTILALQDSRMLLEGMLLEEEQIFISTGLGGKNGKLRYFVAITQQQDTAFTSLQHGIIGKEFRFALENNNSEIEEMAFDKEIATLQILAPLDKPVQLILHSAINECNTMGCGISNQIIVTNVETLNTDDIRSFIAKHN